MFYSVTIAAYSCASALRHTVSQSGAVTFRYRTGSPYSGIGLVPASAFWFIPELTGQMPDSPAFQHL
jgi:hypothetical protein